MSSITTQKNYSSFIQECRFFFCQKLFEGQWDGKEKYIVASDTPEGELLKKYPEIMKALSPYVFCNAACGEAYSESTKNMDKFIKRSKSTISFGEIEVLESQIGYNETDNDSQDLIKEALSVCTPLQRERIIKYYIEGMNLRQIANGKNIANVQQSIQAGLKKIKNYFESDT